jgi:hypothetical protein
LRQTLLALSGMMLLIATIAAIATGPATGAQQTLPTPEGQLGGPMPLPPQGQPGQLPSPTPPATPTPEPATPEAGAPHPSGCRVVARPLQELVLLAQSDSLPPPPSADGGVPDDAATVEGVTSTMQELIACLNAGDQLRAAALLTDDCLARLLVESGWDQDEVMSVLGLLLPRAPERWISVTEVSDVLTLPDDRAAANVVLFDPERLTLGATTMHRVVFQSQDGEWLIDAIASH